MDIDLLIEERNALIMDSNDKAATLALAFCAQRMSNCYEFFAKKHNIDFYWFNKKINRLILNCDYHINMSIRKIELNIPDSEDYPELSASIARDATIILIEAYDFAKSKNKQHVIDGFETMDDTLDFYMQEAQELKSQIEVVEKITARELLWEIESFKLLEDGSKISLNKVKGCNIEYMIPTYSEIFDL